MRASARQLAAGRADGSSTLVLAATTAAAPPPSRLLDVAPTVSSTVVCSCASGDCFWSCCGCEQRVRGGSEDVAALNTCTLHVPTCTSVGSSCGGEVASPSCHRTTCCPMISSARRARDCRMAWRWLGDSRAVYTTASSKPAGRCSSRVMCRFERRSCGEPVAVAHALVPSAHVPAPLSGAEAGSGGHISRAAGSFTSSRSTWDQGEVEEGHM